jgi:LmbE family N-acetylglucosaminyl deacetylase
MKTLRLIEAGDQLSVLCLGAHSDDIEIGAGGTLLTWIATGARIDVTWCVAGAMNEREAEARAAASEFLQGASNATVEIVQFKDGFFPTQSAEIKQWFETLRSRVNPDVVLTHWRNDAHQDHREISHHAWATFRDQLILEYEVPKWDGDLGRPNIYVPLSAALLERKIAVIMRNFRSQHGRHWFDEETFRGLARLRGMECRAPERYAEAFFGSKILLAWSTVTLLDVTGWSQSRLSALTGANTELAAGRREDREPGFATGASPADSHRETPRDGVAAIIPSLTNVSTIDG